jgi:hypothetical protein
MHFSPSIYNILFFINLHMLNTKFIIYMLKINLTLTSLNTLFCFFEQEVLLTIVHIGTRRNNNRSSPIFRAVSRSTLGLGRR